MKQNSGVREVAEHLMSARSYIENYLYITTKAGTFEKLKLNKAQRELMSYVEECLEVGRPIRIRVLKSRQLGISTFTMALAFWWATTNQNQSCGLVAHTADSSQSIFDKARVFYNNLPGWMKPATIRFSSEAISFDYDKKFTKPEEENTYGLKSNIFFGTAGSNQLFRGRTIHFLHKSEKAFWEEPELLNRSLNATVPDLPNTFIIDETTANGYNFFKDEWDASVKGSSVYKPFFFGWNYDENAKMKVEEGFKLLPIEKEYMKKHNLTMEQMRWRRYKILEYGKTLDDIKNDDIIDFQQEYPLTAIEAFIASGRSVFNAKVLGNGLEYAGGVKYSLYELKDFPCDEKVKIYEKPEVIEQKRYEKKVVFNFNKQEYEYQDSELLLGVDYKHANYVIGVDTSGAGQDWNVISVWHTKYKRKVAGWRMRNISEENLAKVCVEIARLYNDAMIAPEINFSQSLVNFITDERYCDYKNVYVLENPTRIDKGMQALRYGWQTTSSTKPLLISKMKAALNEDYTINPDLEFWEEAEYYIQEKTKSGNDTFNAASGHHDDIVMADMIARYVCDSFQVNQDYTLKKNKKEESFIKSSIIESEDNFFERFKKKENNKKFCKGVFKNDA